MDQLTAEKLAIRETVDNWIVWRDAGDWERFKTVWHPEGWMNATWFQGPAEKFIEVSREGFNKGVNILHFYGGFSCDIAGDRAIAQTKMTINQRATVDGVPVDVVCTGRMFDFVQKHEGRWLIRRRQPIYEKDRMDPVTPGHRMELDEHQFAHYPVAYRHLAYFQASGGAHITLGLPTPGSDALARLYAEGEKWLRG